MSLFLSPIGNAAQFFDTNGSPLNGGLITTYQAGSTTLQATYTTSSGVTQNANPIVLGVDGRTPNEIWFTSGIAYKFILTDSLSNVLGTYDNLTGINDTSSAPLTEWIASGLTPTYLSATSFSVAGNQTLVFPVSQRVKTTNTGGTAYSSVATVTYNSGTGLTTVVVVNDSTTLDSGLSAVSYGFTNPTYPSVGIAKTALSATKLTQGTQGYTLTAEQATTSGTSIDFTGIPSWATKIWVMFNGVSTNGTSTVIIQIGPSGAPETTGYIGACWKVGVSSANLSSGFNVDGASGLAADIRYGTILLNLENLAAFRWTAAGQIALSNSATNTALAGIKACASAASRVRITTANGTDAFDAGAISIAYE